MLVSTVLANKTLGGKYRLTELLGQGAMAEVWRAQHLTLGSPVAVKVLSSELASTRDGQRRFLQEAKVVASLRGPNIVQILDLGVEGDRPYLVMELLDGESLEQRLQRQGRLPPQLTCGIVGQIASAVERAHVQGVVHRDLKPANVFLTPSDEGGGIQVKLLDFGIARASARGNARSQLTTQGLFIGTPEYSSPEQAQGLRGVDHRTDIWSLGIITYECLIGSVPFHGETPTQVLVQVCAGHIPIPSRVAEVPAGFDEWFAQTCSRDKAHRFHSAKAASHALTQVLSGTGKARSREGPTHPSAATRAAADAPTAPPAPRAHPSSHPPVASEPATREPPASRGWPGPSSRSGKPRGGARDTPPKARAASLTRLGRRIATVPTSLRQWARPLPGPGLRQWVSARRALPPPSHAGQPPWPRAPGWLRARLDCLPRSPRLRPAVAMAVAMLGLAAGAAALLLLGNGLGPLHGGVDSLASAAAAAGGASPPAGSAHPSEPSPSPVAGDPPLGPSGVGGHTITAVRRLSPRPAPPVRARASLSADGDPNAVLYVDDEPIGPLPASADNLEPGEHVVTVRAGESRIPFEKSLTLEAGQRTELGRIELAPRAAPEPAPSAPSAARPANPAAAPHQSTSPAAARPAIRARRTRPAAAAPKPPRAAPSREPAGGRPECRKPYWVDERGIKRVKLACL